MLDCASPSQTVSIHTIYLKILVSYHTVPNGASLGQTMPYYAKLCLTVINCFQMFDMAYGIFHGKSAAQNFKSSETWLNFFKIMKKTPKPIFSAIYANVDHILFKNA